VAENREDPDRLLHWSTSQNNLARALQQHGQTVEAASLFSRALALLRVIQARSNLDIRKPMATTENNLGRLLAQTGSPVEAAKYFTHAIELLDAAESDGLLMGYVQHNTACLLAPTSPERALDHGTRALKIFDKVRQAERNNSKVASQTAETLAVLGNVRIRLGHLQEGIDALQQSVDLLQPMVAHLPFPLERPEQVEPVEQIALGWYQLGMAHATSHDSKIAIAALDRAANYQRWVVDAAPNRADASATMASILCQLGKMQLAIDRRDTAKSMLEEAVSRQKMAVLSEPDSRRYRDALLAYEDQLGKL
jgi:tetratricopeptide (TPR) repeat protein